MRSGHPDLKVCTPLFEGLVAGEVAERGEEIAGAADGLGIGLAGVAAVVEEAVDGAVETDEFAAVAHLILSDNGGNQDRRLGLRKG